MRTKAKKISCYIGVILIALGVSCKKETKSVPTLFEQISIERWFFETTTGAVYDNCEKHSYYHFFSSGKASVTYYDIDDFGNCIPVTYREGVWELVSEKFIRYTQDGSTDSVEYEIIGISAEKLMLRNNADPSGPVTYSFDKIAG